jgi:hypothetical protein
MGVIMTVKVTVDLSQFIAFTRKAPGIMDGLVKESFTRGAAKMRKEFKSTIDRGNWAALQETDKYRSKYSRPLQVLKSMVRYRVTGGVKKVKATIGIFAGKAGRSSLSNAKFKANYGVTLNRFGKLMTYGGTLRLRAGDRERLVREGFYISKKAKGIVFPKRDWFTPTQWRQPNVILPYIQKDLHNRVIRRLGNGKTFRIGR